MSGNAAATFIELTITQSDLVNAPCPRKGLVDVALIASLDSLEGKDPFRSHCMVTLHEPCDSTVSNDEGEHVVRGSRTLLVRESYESIVALLSEHGSVLRSK